MCGTCSVPSNRSTARIVTEPVDVDERLAAGEQVVDQRQDVIRLRVRLAVPQPQAGVDRLRDTESFDELANEHQAQSVQQRSAAMFLDDDARAGWRSGLDNPRRYDSLAAASDCILLRAVTG